MIQKTETLYHYSSDFNLKTLCPNINLYENRYIDYLDYTHTFPLDRNLIDKYALIENKEVKVAAFSSYLIYNILSNFLDTRTIIKKDVEDYYNSQILNFLRSQNLIGYFQLKYLAAVWTSLNKTIDILLEDLSSYGSILLNQKVFWSDSLDNYYHTVPYIATKNNTVDMFLILQTNHTKYPLQNAPIDYLRIPSVLFTLKSLLTQNISITRLKILWLDSSDITKNFQYLTYRDIPYSYIEDHTNILNLKNNTSLGYPNLELCYSCPYYKTCNSKNLLLTKTPNLPLKILPDKLFDYMRPL